MKEAPILIDAAKEAGRASGLVGPETQRGEGNVYSLLAAHQRDESWFGRALVSTLQAWAGRFSVEFKLDIPEVVLCLERLPKDRYAQFRYGHNGFGLRGEIAFNTLYLHGQREHWLLHAWQQAHGAPGKHNHHNREFRQKAWELGLLVDRRGVTNYRVTSPFKTLLGRHGIEAVEAEHKPAAPKVASRSKLKKWSCGCRPAVNVRVAIANFRARCLLCGCEFVRQEDGA